VARVEQRVAGERVVHADQHAAGLGPEIACCFEIALAEWTKASV